MYDVWKLNQPNLILSVTGGAQKLKLPQRIKKAFKLGLIKAATTTNAWLFLDLTKYFPKIFTHFFKSN